MIITGTAAAAAEDEMPPTWGPCRSEPEEPQLTGTAAEDGVANGDCAGAAEVALATGDCRPGNKVTPGVEDLWEAARAAGA